MSLIEPKPGSTQYALNLADCLASHREASTKLTARRAFGLRLLSFEKLRDVAVRVRWIMFDLTIDARNALGCWPSDREQAARVLAHDLALLRPQSLRWPEGDTVVVDALRRFAGRRARRARAVAWACFLAAVVAMGARDGNCNGRADVLDVAAATWGISGFGPSAPAESCGSADRGAAASGRTSSEYRKGRGDSIYP